MIEEKDPTEPFEPEPGSVIIDTVAGLDRPRLFTSLDDFMQSARVSVHDYDLYLHLSLLQKIGKLSDIRIIGVPPASVSAIIMPFVISLIHKKIPVI